MKISLTNQLFEAKNPVVMQKGEKPVDQQTDADKFYAKIQADKAAKAATEKANKSKKDKTAAEPKVKEPKAPEGAKHSVTDISGTKSIPKEAPMFTGMSHGNPKPTKGPRFTNIANPVKDISTKDNTADISNKNYKTDITNKHSVTDISNDSGKTDKRVFVKPTDSAFDIPTYMRKQSFAASEKASKYDFSAPIYKQDKVQGQAGETSSKGAAKVVREPKAKPFSPPRDFGRRREVSPKINKEKSPRPGRDRNSPPSLDNQNINPRHKGNAADTMAGAIHGAMNIGKGIKNALNRLNSGAARYGRSKVF